jgi:hypothetical protein
VNWGVKVSPIPAMNFRRGTQKRWTVHQYR